MKNILIVDDDKTFVGLITPVFDSTKYLVVSAENGEEALKKMESFKPDVILLDIIMPTMNGMDFLKQMNKRYGMGKIPVIMTSNLASFEKIAEGVEMGIRAYIVKSTESMQGIVTATERILA